MITIISCGITNAPEPSGDLTFDCREMPDPSPVIHDLPGTHPLVLRVLLQSNPLVAPMLDFIVGATRNLSYHQSDVSLVLMCSAGGHRSVAIAEEVGRRLRVSSPDDVIVIHRDLRTS